ncbi:acyl carrier protein [Streptomyces sp. URMC 123]|uniref:acyl carrier protein n=1 Tax=Streptomyces sp. URMC 123 TaxID=3423403 RepID=UPI003F1BC7B1
MQERAVDIEAKVTGYLQQHFGIGEDQLRPDATLEELGMDSLALMELLVIVEEETGVQVTERLDGLDSQATLAQAIARMQEIFDDPEPQPVAGTDGAR